MERTDLIVHNNVSVEMRYVIKLLDSVPGDVRRDTVDRIVIYVSNTYIFSYAY